jgi:hypothetical protein
MKIKIKTLLLVLSIISCAWSLTYAAPTVASVNTRVEIDRLEGQLAALQSQVAQLKSDTQRQNARKAQTRKPRQVKRKKQTRRPVKKTRRSEESKQQIRNERDLQVFREVYIGDKKPVKRIFGNSVVVAPFTGEVTYNTGSGLVINSSSINEDAKLLFRRQMEHQMLVERGITTPQHPRLVLSGKVVGQASYERPYDGAKSSDINLSSAELDAFAEVTRLVNGFMAFSYEGFAGSTPRRVSNSNVKLSKGFIVIGDFSKFALYGTIGQIDVPFGRYSTNMIGSPVTKYIGKTKARAIVVGYSPEDRSTPYGRVFLFKGDSKYGNSSMVKQGGLDIGYHYMRGKFLTTIGGSYIMNVADAEGMQNTGYSAGMFTGFNQTSTATMDYEQLVHRVGGIDFYGKTSFGKYSLLGEFVSSLQRFSGADLTFNGHGAKPKAFNVEGTYSFVIFKHPSSFAIGYGQTDQALALNIPKQRYAASLRSTILDNTTATVSFQHDINYRDTDRATGRGQPAAANNELGSFDNILKAELGVYF